MILQLYNKQIIIKGNEAPEDITHTKIQYAYELGTNHLVPTLQIQNEVYKGDNIYVSFDYKVPTIRLKVHLMDGAGNIVRTYSGEYPIYRTFTIGTQEHINVYKALIKANEKIKQLQEEGDVI